HDHPITPTIDTLSFFIIYMSAHIRPDSVAVYLTGVCNRLEADFPEVCQNRANPVVKRTLVGCLCCVRQQPSWKPPLDLTHLHSFLHGLTPPSTHDDLLFAVLLVSGFHVLMCLSELVWPDSIQLQSYCKVILRCSLKLDVDSFSSGLPTHKVLKVGHGSDILVCCFSPDVDPLQIMHQYVHSRNNLFFLSPELWLTKDGRVSTCAWFIRHLQRACGFEFTGHSMRAGGATTLALLGTTPHVIQ
ncbi:hypothetical protein OG21DRAFT_1371751, partial [Imleria badia]